MDNLLSETSQSELESKVNVIRKCFDCGKERSSVEWCKDCETNALKEDFKNWTSGNFNIDNFIKYTQLNAEQSVDYLEFIDFEQFDLVENTNKGGTASTIYSAIWLEGPRWIWDEDAEQLTRNGPIKVTLKRLNNLQNMGEDYLKQVSYCLVFISIYLNVLLFLG